MFLLFAYFFYYFPPLPALCMEIRVWIFSSRLSANDCRKEKKKKATDLSPAIIVLLCVCSTSRVIFFYFVFFFLFLFCYTHLEMMLRFCRCMCDTELLCLYNLLLFFFSFSLLDWSHGCISATCFIIFFSPLSGGAFDFSLFCSICKNQEHINMLKSSLV